MRALWPIAFMAVILLGCSSSHDDGVGPTATAERLVQALNAGDFGAIVPTAATATVDIPIQAAEVLEPLLDATGFTTPSVRLVSVTPPTTGNAVGSTALAILDWEWPFELGGEWSYETQALLEFEGEHDSAGWFVSWQPDILVPDLVIGERLTVSRAPAPRSAIFDGAGDKLVMERPVWRIGIDKTFIPAEQWEQGARELVELIGSVGYQFDADAYAARVAAAGERAFVELITLRQENSPVTRSEVEHVPGARALDEMRDLAPTATFARAILGTAGEATAEIIEASGGRIQPGDTTGLSGLQRTYNDQLAGQPGITIKAFNPYTDATRELLRLDPMWGIPLDTTFNVPYQLLAEQVLSNVGPASAIVAIQPSTGEVLVAANGPGAAGQNLALLGQYPPGSTFKIVDALALKRAGFTPQTPVPCTESIEVDGRVFRNVPGYPVEALGQVPFRTAFAHSCNTAFIAQAPTIPAPTLAQAGADLGFGVMSPVGVGTFFGSIPNEASGTNHAANLLGQGTVAASPFTMARVAASVAAGHRVDPVLVYPAEPVIVEEPPSSFTPQEAEFLIELMAAVVADGSAQMLQDIPGIRGAKTGTAQFGDGSQNHTWMVAIIDTRDPATGSGIDLAVAVFVEEGEFGATTSGPLMHEFLAGVTTGG